MSENDENLKSHGGRRASSSQVAAWEAAAGRWAKLVREGSEGLPAYDLVAFLELLPGPPRRVLDLGCGEGRLSRALSARGYRVVGVDASPTLIGLARELDPDGDYRLADAAALPFEDGAFDVVLAYLSLQDMDAPEAAIVEAGRTLEPGGWLCLAIIHPIWSAGDVEEDGARFVIRGSYLATRPHLRPVLRLPSVHRPLEDYFRGLEHAGLLVETLRELPNRGRFPGLPDFLHARAVKP